VQLEYENCKTEFIKWAKTQSQEKQKAREIEESLKKTMDNEEKPIE
jgi:hypothetical protein